MGSCCDWEEASVSDRAANPEITDAPEEIVLEHLSRVVVEPGDVLVFRTSSDLPLEAHRHITAAFKDIFPDNRLVILQRDDELSVVRTAE